MLTVHTHICYIYLLKASTIITWLFRIKLLNFSRIETDPAYAGLSSAHVGV